MGHPAPALAGPPPPTHVFLTTVLMRVEVREAAYRGRMVERVRKLALITVRENCCEMLRLEMYPMAIKQEYIFVPGGVCVDLFCREPRQ